MEELNSSELGTEEYWSKFYEQELEEFHDNGSEGYIWFGLKSVKSIINWMSNSNLVDVEDSVLEVGFGNGYLLKELAKNGFKNLKGIDYVQSAVDLAKLVTSHENSQISFETNDILRDLNTSDKDSLGCLGGTFKIILDKGTFDAVTLSVENPQSKRSKYVENIHHLLKEDGLFIICSCNLVKEEIIAQFNNGFKFLDEVPFPKITFGGKTGTVLSLVIFKKLET